MFLENFVFSITKNVILRLCMDVCVCVYVATSLVIFENNYLFVTIKSVRGKV